MCSFDERFRLANEAAFSGWDFSFLKGRVITERLPWDYRDVVLQCIKEYPNLVDVLDMGTGGGEFLSALFYHLPGKVHATESYPPNIAIATERLKPLGITVHPIEEDIKLPFADSTFGLVINRHESYSPQEVQRILKPCGMFVTQQVGDKNHMELNRFFGYGFDGHFYWCLKKAKGELEEAGLEIVRYEECFVDSRYLDIEGVIYYLRAIPWQIPGFVVEEHKDQLRDLHDYITRHGEFRSREHRFLLVARKCEG